MTAEDLELVGTMRSLQELNVAGCSAAALSAGHVSMLTGLTGLTALQLSLQQRLDPQFWLRNVIMGLGALAALPLEVVRVWRVF